MSTLHAATPDPGTGEVLVERDAAGKSVVVRAWARAPLVVLEPRGLGGAAWLVAGTLGGGLVDGDRVELDVGVGAGATCLLATQAQTKAYRGASSQRLALRVGAGALVVCAPDPVACFAGARYAQTARIVLDGDASIVWLEGVTCGRRAHGERWAFASYASRVVIERGGAAILRDAVVLDEAHGAIGDRLGRFDALATIAAIGPRAEPVAQALLAGARTGDVLVAPSPIAGGAIARVAARSVEAAQRAVRELLAPLTGSLGDDPFRGR
jgi:urease accessory protein